MNNTKQKILSFDRIFCFDAGGRGRTDTVLLPRDFESRTSANSITPANIKLTFVLYHKEIYIARKILKIIQLIVIIRISVASTIFDASMWGVIAGIANAIFVMITTKIAPIATPMIPPRNLLSVFIIGNLEIRSNMPIKNFKTSLTIKYSTKSAAADTASAEICSENMPL